MLVDQFEVYIFHIGKQTKLKNSMNRQVPQQWKVPKYSEKFKDVLERAYQRQKMKEKASIIQYKPPFFYRVRSIGVGAFSFVYLVIQQNSGAIFAQKAIHKKKITQSLFIEIKLHLSIQHPNIITLHHIYSEDDYVHLIMDYAGQSLFNLRRNKILQSKMNINGLRHILLQIASAIKYLHDRQIVHGDIKLENILMLEGVFKLCDLGLAQSLVHSGTCSGKLEKQVVGTLQYLSPQYVQGMSSGKERDIWAFGIVCYELFFGQNPLEGIPQNQKWSKMLTMTSVKIPNEPIPYEVKQLLQNTLCPIQIRMPIQKLLQLPLLTLTNECSIQQSINSQLKALV